MILEYVIAILLTAGLVLTCSLLWPPYLSRPAPSDNVSAARRSPSRIARA
jgi:hypothetical protein